eukprot:4008859-Prymnesium_polylepis.1
MRLALEASLAPHTARCMPEHARASWTPRAGQRPAHTFHTSPMHVRRLQAGAATACAATHSAHGACAASQAPARHADEE